jgi:hypothetical protein
VWAAHVVLCRYGKARMSSDLMFLLGFSVGEQMGLLMGASKAAQSSPSSPAHAHPAARTSAWTSSARHLKHLYLQGGARVRESYRAALVLESAVERALNNRWWASVVWSGKEMGRWVGALQARREYWSNPALTPQIKSLFPWALATTNLANHAAALAQETLSAVPLSSAPRMLPAPYVRVCCALIACLRWWQCAVHQAGKANTWPIQLTYLAAPLS